MKNIFIGLNVTSSISFEEYSIKESKTFENFQDLKKKFE